MINAEERKDQITKYLQALCPEKVFGVPISASLMEINRAHVLEASKYRNFPEVIALLDTAKDHCTAKKNALGTGKKSSSDVKAGGSGINLFPGSMGIPAHLPDFPLANMPAPLRKMWDSLPADMPIATKKIFFMALLMKLKKKMEEMEEMERSHEAEISDSASPEDMADEDEEDEEEAVLQNNDSAICRIEEGVKAENGNTRAGWIGFFVFLIIVYAIFRYFF